MRRLMLFITAVFLALIIPAAGPVYAVPRCFAETGYCIDGRFRQYWEQNGGLAVFGFPIGPARAEVNADTGQTYLTQWFERIRFELHPENARPYDVLLGRLGNDRLLQQGRNWFDFPKANPSAPHYFAETGHAVAEVFWSYWSSHGLEFDGRAGTSFNESLALFGMPLSEPAYETNSSGDTVLTQWFERARFEHHPHNPDRYKVLLGLLGNEVRPAQAPPPSDPCAEVPDPMSGRIRPATCVPLGEPISLDIYGFQRHEAVDFWLTTPEGTLFGAVQTINIGAAGAASDLPFDTRRLWPGLWYWIFEGKTSGHQAIIYFKLLPVSGAGPAPKPMLAQ